MATSRRLPLLGTVTVALATTLLTGCAATPDSAPGRATASSTPTGDPDSGPGEDAATTPSDLREVVDTDVAVERRPLVPDEERLLVLPPSDDVWPDAAAEGVLDVNERGCVTVRSGSEELLIMAVHGSRVTDAGRIRFPDVDRGFLLGDPVIGGGAELSGDSFRDLWLDCVEPGSKQSVWVFRPR